MTELTDVRCEVDRGLAWITIDRPDRMNAFRAHTVDELIDCFKRAWADPDVGVVCLTGAGDRAFCTGGDQKQRAESGDYGPSASGLFEVAYLHRVVPAAELRDEVRRWGDEILALPPTALRFLKQSFNAETEPLAGRGSVAFSGLNAFLESDEAREGVTAFAEKRPPDFARYRARVSV